MSRPVKEMITNVYTDRFVNRDGVVVIKASGIKSITNVAMRDTLREKGLRITVVKNTLARQATEGTPLEPLSDVLDGSCAVVYTVDPEGSVVNVARVLMDEKKAMPFIEFQGAVLEGATFKADQIEALSKYPTREEAIGKLVGALLGPASTLTKLAVSPGENLASALKGTAGIPASLVKAVEEKGGEVKKVA